VLEGRRGLGKLREGVRFAELLERRAESSLPGFGGRHGCSVFAYSEPRLKNRTRPLRADSASCAQPGVACML